MTFSRHYYNLVFWWINFDSINKFIGFVVLLLVFLIHRLIIHFSSFSNLFHTIPCLSPGSADAFSMNLYVPQWGSDNINLWLLGDAFVLIWKHSSYAHQFSFINVPLIEESFTTTTKKTLQLLLLLLLLFDSLVLSFSVFWLVPNSN